MGLEIHLPFNQNTNLTRNINAVGYKRIRERGVGLVPLTWPVLDLRCIFLGLVALAPSGRAAPGASTVGINKVFLRKMLSCAHMLLAFLMSAT